MKKLMYTLALALITSFAISSCTEENIRPQDGGTNGSSDPCQYGCK